MSRTDIASALAVLAFLCPAGKAVAQDRPDKFWIEVGAYWPDVDSAARVSSTQDPSRGTSIDLESDLDLSDRDALPQFLAGMRIGDDLALSGEFYSLSRSGSVSLAREIAFDDVTYPVGATVDSAFATDVYRATLSYVFWRSGGFSAGGALGLHATSFEVALEGVGNVGDVSGQTQTRRREVLAPLPTLGLFATYALTGDLTLGARADYLSLSIGDYDGRLANIQAEASYRLFENIGVGVMYRYVDYRVDVEKDRWRGRVAYEFKGPAAFVRLAF